MCKHSCWVDIMSQNHARNPFDAFKLRNRFFGDPNLESCNATNKNGVFDNMIRNLLLKSLYLDLFPKVFG